MFGKKLREAQVIIETQRTMLSQQEGKLKCLQAENNQLSKMLNEVKDERSKLKKQVREQTEADLLMVSMKIIEEIKKGVPKNDPNLISMQREQEKLRALRAQGAAYSRSNWGLQDMAAMGKLV